MNPTPTPTHARIIPTMTPTLAQIDVAQRLARAYSHAWACPEGDEVVERWRAAGAVPAHHRVADERSHRRFARGARASASMRWRNAVGVWHRTVTPSSAIRRRSSSKSGP